MQTLKKKKQASPIEEIKTVVICVSILRRLVSEPSRKAFHIWRAAIEDFFTGKISTAEIQYAIKIALQSVRSFHLPEESKEQSDKLLLNYLSAQIGGHPSLPKRIEVLSLIRLYIRITELQKMQAESGPILTFFEKLLTECGIKEADFAKIDDKGNRLYFKHVDPSKKKQLLIPGSILPISIEYILRWVVLGFYQIYELDLYFLLFMQAVVIPLTGVLVGLGYNYRVNRRYEKILGKLQETNLLLTVRPAAWQYAFLVIYSLSGLAISTVVFPQLSGSGLFLVFLVQVGYLLVIFRLLSPGIMSENEIYNQLLIKSHDDEEPAVTSLSSADDNDEALVALEVAYESNKQRMDTYILEAGLFGALAFSAFVPVVADEFIKPEDLFNFKDGVYKLLNLLVSFKSSGYEAVLAQLSSKGSLLCLVCSECLLCSVFFLSVVASRLQFSRYSDRLDQAIKIAQAFNEKEEALLDSVNGNTDDPRLKYLSKRIRQEIEAGKSVLAKTQPILEYMEFFRGLGINFFYIIIISASLLISGSLSYVFIGLSLLSLLYFRIPKSILRAQDLLTELSDWLFIYRGQIRLMLVLTAAAGVFWNFLYWDTLGDSLGLIGFVGLAFYSLFACFFPGDSRSVISTRQVIVSDQGLEGKLLESQIKKWNFFVNLISGTSLFVLYLTILFHFLLHAPGSNVLMLATAVAWTVRILLEMTEYPSIRYLRSYLRQRKQNTPQVARILDAFWRSIRFNIMAIGFALIIMGGVLDILKLRIGLYLLIIGLPAVILGIIDWIRSRSDFNTDFRNYLIGSIFIVLLAFFDTFEYSIVHTTLNYNELRSFSEYNKITNKKIDELKSQKEYVYKVSTTFLDSFLLIRSDVQPNLLIKAATWFTKIFDPEQDTIALNKALYWSRKAQEIASNTGDVYYGTATIAKLLIQLNKIDLADFEIHVALQGVTDLKGREELLAIKEEIQRLKSAKNLPN